MISGSRAKAPNSLRSAFRPPWPARPDPAPASAHCGLEQSDRAGIGVHFCANADRQAELVFDMAEQGALVSRHAQRFQMLAKHFRKGETAIGSAADSAIAALAEN